MNIVLGDSHAEVFDWINRQLGFEVFDVLKVPGATALGLLRPDSRTDALNKFRLKIQESGSEISNLIIMVGEVDCGFLCWLLQKEKGLDPYETLEKSVNNLVNMVNGFVASGKVVPHKVVVFAVPTPPKLNYSNPKFLHGLRRNVQLNRDQISTAIKFYNKKLEEATVYSGYRYIDLYTSLLSDNDSDDLVRSVEPSFDCDHHLYAPSLAGPIVGLLLQEGPEDIRARLVESLQVPWIQHFHWYFRSWQRVTSNNLMSRCLGRVLRKLS